MEELISRVADSALTIVVLVSWLIMERREKMLLWERMNNCLSRMEDHITEHIE